MIDFKALALAGALLLAGCGGTSTRDPYIPPHIHAFGDDLTVLDATGHRQGVNGVSTITTTNADGSTSTTTTFNCALLPLWSQQLASAFGVVSKECPGSATGFGSTLHGAVGAKAADLAAQLNGAGLVTNDLAVIHVGLNDIVEIYETMAASVAGGADHGVALNQAVAEARSRGTAVANQVVGLIGRGVKVALLTPPAMQHSPWARALGSTAVDDIGQISEALSIGIRLIVGRQDARDVIMAVGTDIVLGVVNAANDGANFNVTTAACPDVSALAGCLSSGLVSGASIDTYLWAGDKIPGWMFHSAAGSEVVRLAVFF